MLRSTASLLCEKQKITTYQGITIIKKGKTYQDPEFTGLTFNNSFQPEIFLFWLLSYPVVQVENILLLILEQFRRRKLVLFISMYSGGVCFLRPYSSTLKWTEVCELYRNKLTLVTLQRKAKTYPSVLFPRLFSVYRKS